MNPFAKANSGPIGASGAAAMLRNRPRRHVICSWKSTVIRAYFPSRFREIPFLLAAAVGCGGFALSLRADPMPVKAAVVVTFEVGADTGDQPGEFQFWAEREKWPIKINVPGVDHPVLTDGKGTIGVGMDADLVALDATGSAQTVIILGEVHVQRGIAIRRGTFEP